MAELSTNNPVFVTYMITAALMILKIMGQGWMTVYRMMKSDSGLVSPEDIQFGAFNKNPRPEQLAPNDYVDRSRRMHRNDLENIPAFLACGLIFVAAGPSLLLANILMYTFVAARVAHTVAYADVKEQLSEHLKKQKIDSEASAYIQNLRSGAKIEKFL